MTIPAGTGEFSDRTLATLQRVSDQALERLDADGSNNDDFNRAAFGFAVSWVNAGGGEDGYVEAVSRSNLGASYYRNDLERRLRKTFGQAEEKAQDYNPPTGQVREQLEALLERLKDSSLPVGLRTSAIALVELGAGINTWTVDMSTRRLAELTGCTPATAGKHLKKLREIGLVSRTKRNGRGQARTFVIDTSYEPPSEVALSEVYTDYTHIDLQEHMCKVLGHYRLLWTKHGLGPTAEKVYRSVPIFPATVADLARRSALNRQTVTRHLARLVGLDLVVRLEGPRSRYALNLLPDYAGALEATGAVQAQEEQREKHEQDRAVFREENRRLAESYLAEGGNAYQHESLFFATDGRRYRVNKAGLEEIRRTGTAWEHSRVPLRYREYEPEIDSWPSNPVPTEPRPRTSGPTDPFAHLEHDDPPPRPRRSPGTDPFG